MQTREFGPILRICAVVMALPLMAACGPLKRMAINSVASTLAQSGTSATSDNDPDLVESALPYQLKLQEGLLESIPHNEGLLLATCRLATEYGYAFIQGKADMLGEEHHEQVVALRDRALKMYLRGKGYCVRALDQKRENTSAALEKDPKTMALALKKFKKKEDVEFLYWTAASWGAALSLGRDQPDLFVDFPVVRALIDQARSIDESWNKGAIPELMITLDSLPAAMGGNPENARKDFDRAVELQHGSSPGPYVSFALNVAQPAQDRETFKKLLDQALAIDPEKDPDNRLVTILTQRKARALLDQIDTLFTGKQLAH